MEKLVIATPRDSRINIKGAFIILVYPLLFAAGISILGLIFGDDPNNVPALIPILATVLGVGVVFYLLVFILAIVKTVFNPSNVKLISGDCYDGLAVGEYNDDDDKAIESYDGEYKNAVRCGYGKYNFYNKDYYEGNWKDDMMNGEGKYVWKSGHIYQGKFSNGKRHGLGELTLKNGKNYSGVWHLDRLQ